MNNERLQNLLGAMAGQRLLIVGDYFLDLYLEIDQRLAEPSLETGLDAHQVVARRASPGAAGNVAANARALGAEVMALGVIGDDGNGHDLMRALERRGVVTDALVHSDELLTPTYTKPLLTGVDGQVREMNRLDIKNRRPLPKPIGAELLRRLHALAGEVDGIIVNDQVPEPDHGAITARLRAGLAALGAARPELPITVDSRKRIGLYDQVMLKPNEHETLSALGWAQSDDLARISAAAQALALRTGRVVFCTVGARGCLVCAAEDVLLAPAVPVRGDIDIVGAGDTALAAISTSLCAGATPYEAALVGNLAASVSIRCLGTTGTASPQQIMAAYESWPEHP